jgi:hypothetical protein
MSHTVNTMNIKPPAAGAMPAPEPDYWELASGPAWPWWVLAILPVDAQLQVSKDFIDFQFTSLTIC